MVHMTPTTAWRRWLRDVLLTSAAIVLLTATGALPAAAGALGLV